MITDNKPIVCIDLVNRMEEFSSISPWIDLYIFSSSHSLFRINIYRTYHNSFAALFSPAILSSLYLSHLVLFFCGFFLSPLLLILLLSSVDFAISFSVLRRRRAQTRKIMRLARNAQQSTTSITDADTSSFVFFFFHILLLLHFQGQT